MKEIAAQMIVLSAGVGLTVVLVKSMGCAGTLLMFGAVVVLLWALNTLITGWGDGSRQ